MDKTITHSSMTVFWNCRKRFFYEYVKRLAPLRVSGALTIGKAVHDACAALAEGGTCKQGLDLASAPFDKDIEKIIEIRPEIVPMIENDQAVAEATYLAYHEHYMDDEIEYMEVEKNIGFPIDGTKWKYRGKADAIVRHPMLPGPSVHERKTTSRLDTAFLMQQERKFQVTGYIMGARSTGFDILGSLLDIYKKPKLVRRADEKFDDYVMRLRNKMLERPDVHFHRVFGDRNVPKERDFMNKLKHTANEIQRCLSDPALFVQNEDRCSDYFKPCPYMSLCENGMGPAEMNNFRVKKHQHEELDG